MFTEWFNAEPFYKKGLLVASMVFTILIFTMTLNMDYSMVMISQHYIILFPAIAGVMTYILHLDECFNVNGKST